MQLKLLSTGLALLLLGGSALAQEIQLDEVLVTAGRTPAPTQSVGRAYTILEGERLEADQVRDVADALRRVPGLSVSGTGTFGGLTQLRVRGSEGNHVLVLIDGVEASETSTGEFDFGTLLAAEVERIEVLRGPQSAFFGSNALAGVVNIITKGGIRNGRAADVTIEGGSFGTGYGAASLRGGGTRWDGAISVAGRSTDGFNLSRFGTEDDGSRNATLNAKGTFDLTETLTLDGNLRAVDQRVDTDGADFVFPPTATAGRIIDTDEDGESTDLLGSVGLTSVLLDGALTQRLRLSGNETRRTFDVDGTRSSASEGSRIAGLYQATYAFETPEFAEAKHQITGGYEIERETFRAREPVFDATQLERQRRDLQGLVAEYRGTFLDQFHLTGAVRQDFNDAFEDVATYSASAAWQIPNRGTRLHASLGTGVTNPTFFEQFGFIPGSFIGNESLKPEESFGWDIGVEQRFLDDRLVVDLTYFRQDLENEIVTLFTPTFRSTAENQEGTSKRQGVEVAGTLNIFDGFSATASYTYTDATDPDGEIEVRRPKHSGSFTAAYVFADDRARIFAETIFNGRMDDLEFAGITADGRVTLDSYTLVTIGGSYKFTDTLEGFARVENLFDEDYEEVFDFRTAGRGAFAGLKARF